MAKKPSLEMSMEEARAYRASLAQDQTKLLSEQERREAFRLFWAQEKYKYGKPKELENVLWLHLRAIKMDSPESFEKGLQNFGLSKEK
jgi:membrane-anchored protein YejM (alkaline phosphatase superfamily)